MCVHTPTHTHNTYLLNVENWLMFTSNTYYLKYVLLQTLRKNVSWLRVPFTSPHTSFFPPIFACNLRRINDLRYLQLNPSTQGRQASQGREIKRQEDFYLK